MVINVITVIASSFLSLFLLVPKVEFRHPTYEVNENDGTITAEIVRTGDLSIESTVRCYTRQGSAQVMMDYDERPNTEASIVTFLPGTIKKKLSDHCVEYQNHVTEIGIALIVMVPKKGSLCKASGTVVGLDTCKVSNLLIVV